MKGLKGLLIGLSAAPAFLAVEGGPAGAGGEIITQPSCFRLKNCTFGPKSIVYVPSYPLYATPQQCASPAPVSTTATSVLNRGEFTLSTSSKVPLLFASIPYAESASMKQGTTTQWNLQATLDQYTANHAVAPGLLNVDAAYYACEDPYQVHSPAPLQCTLKSCVAFPDTWPPKSLAVCPSYLSANTVTYGDMTFYTHLKDPFKEQDTWGKVLDKFVQWSDHVSNFPCVVSDVAQSRCDSFTVLSKSLGRRTALDLVGGSDSNKLTVLRHLGTPTESELVELKAIAQKMDLTLDAPIPDAAAVCTKCVHTERVLKEWVHPATCATPELTAPKCQGTETCNLNHCVSFVPKDLFSATLAVSPRALERTTQAKSRPMASQFKDEVVYDSASDTIRLVYITKVDKEELAVDGLVDVTSDSRGAFVKSQVTWVVQPPYEPAVRQPWIALNGSRVLLRAFQGQNKPTTVAITVRAWTPCGQIASKKYLLRVYQEGSPKLRVFSRVRKYIESLMVQENGSVSFLVLIGAVVVGVVGAVMWTVRRPRGGNDDGSAAYVLVGDSTML